MSKSLPLFSFVLVIFLCLGLVHSVFAADGKLYVSPDTGNFRAGEIFTVEILADTDGELINAAEAELTFDPESLFIESISPEGSILTTWSTDPTFSNTDGTLTFSGWTDQSFSGEAGLLLTVNFRALRSTKSGAQLAAGVILSANNGTNIVTAMRSGLYNLDAEERESVVTNENITEDQLEVNRAVAPPLLLIESDRYRAGERLIIKGHADPDQDVLVVLLSEDGQLVEQKLRADEGGDFVFVTDEEASAGMYSMWATALAADERVLAESGRTSFLVKGNEGMTERLKALSVYGLPLAALLLLVSLCAVVFGYFTHRRKRR